VTVRTSTGSTPSGSSSSTAQGVTVELAGLRRSFGAVHALDGMQLSMSPGEMVVLLGPSGCGKTTALRVLAGLEEADEGRIVVDGRDITRMPTNKRDMGMVFQAYSLFPHLTAQQNVEFGLRLRGIDAAARTKRAAENLELVGLAAQAGRYAHQMSGGQQQRVALARALAIQPQVLLLDEPLSALDAKVRVQLRDQIRRIQLEVGITTLFVTHDQEEALAVADRVGVMRDGRIEQIGAPDEIYNRPTSRFVAEFIGSTNRLAGTSAGAVADVLGATVPLLPGSPSSGPVTVLVRPEAVRLTPGADGPGAATVVATSFLGAHGRVQVRLRDDSLVVAQLSAPEVSALQPGGQVTVVVQPVEALATVPG
jgi:putative spermidine/putrescine transport system ATP-binding protein